MNKEIKPHQQRVIDEKTELDIKLEKLNSFFNTKIFQDLNQDDKFLLHEQSIIMGDYPNILQERINHF